MTVTELAKICASYIARGAANFEVTVFNNPDGDHGPLAISDVLERPYTDTIEICCGSRMTVTGEPNEPEEQELDDLI